MTNEVNYLETAKAQMKQIEDVYSVEYVKAFALVVIANAFIAIAEKVVEK